MNLRLAIGLISLLSSADLLYAESPDDTSDNNVLIRRELSEERSCKGEKQKWKSKCRAKFRWRECKKKIRKYGECGAEVSYDDCFEAADYYYTCHDKEECKDIKKKCKKDSNKVISCKNLARCGE